VSSTLRRPALRVEVLNDGDREDLVRLVDADPLVNVVVSARLRAVAGLDSRRFGGTLVGVRDRDGRLTGAAFSGGNLLPIGGGPPEWQALAENIARGPRTCTSMVGRAAAVGAMCQVLAPVWGPARAIRAQQPLLMLDRAAVTPHPREHRVRLIEPAELEAYLPAAAAMFTEELGISPYQASGSDYRRRTAALINDRRAFGIVENDEVVFKADLGALSEHTCQVQGVWVRPDLRGRGIGTAALAVVLRHGLTLAPTVSLYVNDFNLPARKMYDRLGMRQVAVLSTVLF
jgi:uncharacterized protein